MNAKNTLRNAAAVSLLLLLSGCTSGTLLSSQTIADLDAGRGTVTLILYGGQNAHDLRTIAIIDRSDDPYSLLPYGAAFNYRIIENLSMTDALERGERFINDLYSYRATEKRAIHAPDHTVIGHELRPLFMPLDTGLLGNVLDISYVLQADDNRVTVFVEFKSGFQDPQDATEPFFIWGR